jgi:hypothetical protein
MENPEYLENMPIFKKKTGGTTFYRNIDTDIKMPASNVK